MRVLRSLASLSPRKKHCSSRRAINPHSPLWISGSLPPGDGIEAARELRSQCGIGSVFATAHGDRATRARAKDVQPLGWLTKPYSAKSVVETIRAALA